MTHIADPRRPERDPRRSGAVRVRRAGPRRASPDAAVAAAAHDVLVPVLERALGALPPACIDAAVARRRSGLRCRARRDPDGRAKTAGSRSATPRPRRSSRCERRRRRASSCSDSAYPRAPRPASTAYARYAVRFRAEAGRVTPFVLRDGSQFRPGPPYAVTDKRYTADFNEVKRLGGNGVTTPSARTPDQTQIALLLVRELADAVEPDRPDGRRRTGLDMWQRRACSRCSTWPSRTATSAPSRPSTLQLLAAGHRDPPGGDRRQPRHGRRSELDAAAADAADPRL